MNQENRNPLVPEKKSNILLPAFLLSLLIISGCASPRQGPHYAPPSVAPVRKQISEASSHVSSAQTHAAKAKEAIAQAISAGLGDPVKLKLSLDLADTEIDELTQE